MKERRRSKHTGETPSAFYFQPKEREEQFTQSFIKQKEKKKKKWIFRKKKERNQTVISKQKKDNRTKVFDNYRFVYSSFLLFLFCQR